MTIGTLNLCFGQSPSSGILEDVADLLSLSKDEVFELIDLLFKWYPKGDVDEEWKEWAAKLEKDAVEKKKNAIRLLLFVGKGIADNSVSEAEARSDIEKLGIPKEYLERLLIKIAQSADFKNAALDKKRPFETVLSDIDWRVDRRFYCDKTEELVAVIEFIYRNKGEKESIAFDLNVSALRHLISVLGNIEGALCQK